jgi:hypothetical protein
MTDYATQLTKKQNSKRLATLNKWQASLPPPIPVLLLPVCCGLSLASCSFYVARKRRKEIQFSRIFEPQSELMGEARGGKFKIYTSFTFHRRIINHAQLHMCLPLASIVPDARLNDILSQSSAAIHIIHGLFRPCRKRGSSDRFRVAENS